MRFSEADSRQLQAPTLARQLRLFVALHGACNPLIGFGGMLVLRDGGMAALVQYTGLMLAAIVAGVASAFVLGQRLGWRAQTLARVGFLCPAVLLWWAQGRPVVLALAVGGFIGLTSIARQWAELSLLDDGQRDHHAADMTVWAIAGNLVATLVVSAVLTGADDAPLAVYGSYALLTAVGAFTTRQGWPATPPVALARPLDVVRQPAYRASLGLYFLESGLLGVGLVVGTAAATHALGRTSHYGWAASLATITGALALLALRHRRHAGNRVRWMGLAALGMALAYLMLGATTGWPWLFVPHMVFLAGVRPFWEASEQVLNQRALDLHGPLADRILVREVTLGLFRVAALVGFWALASAWSAERQLIVGATAMAVVIGLEWAVGRAWLRQHGQPAPISASTH